MVLSLTREQARRLDSMAIEDLGIPGIVLMENAGRGAADIISAAMDERGLTRAMIFCGAGNNGGDGFVIARHLHNAGREAVVRLAVSEAVLRGDGLVQYRIVERMGIAIGQGHDARCAHDLRTSDVAVDALLGTGFRGQLRAPLVELVEAINAAPKGWTVAIDVPSGLDCDTGLPGGAAIRADLTVTFAAPKIGFLRPEAVEWTGAVRIVGIGTPPSLVERVAHSC